MNITIRRGTAEDVPQAFELVQELALYEKAPEQVTNTPEMMLKDGFGPEPIFGLFVAEVDGKVVGISLYYYRYSTWKGKRLYLEDIVVTESMRGYGLGKQLFDVTVEEAKNTQCTGMMWQVLDWNEPAIQFYKKYGTRFDEGWINCHLDF
ncbi:GNAT family N-acetyltransferase [Runella rosea]|jgi:GNAT superfamily N-acetyltransferase|uniref:GNAT family N-acetyltransferase n=2 Tax=Runella TaxID=105 RepID=A0A344THD4_9BACT|nr:MULTISPECIES: GNAT family N-acetyltransferase [Runella]AXE18055.1 GNAT family N-acetyltransferase [Runella rosea]MCP1383943.1 GNAT family N-acetyltransferase [Runella salmonicolor]NBB22245.1 GNAT family N-acetyltransferase [Runella sp. CRIBMP]